MKTMKIQGFLRYWMLTCLLVCLASTTDAQTMNIVTGNVVTAVTASADKMNYTQDGTLLTVCGKTFAISDIDRIYIDENVVEDNTVTVAYNDTEATVTVAGNIAQYITATVNGAHVSIVQAQEVGDDTCGEITYSLAGNSSDGEFTMTGSYKATVELRGLNLTNPAGAAINIQDGKRIEVSVKNGTVNTLTDGANGSQKAAFVCKGHTEFKGKGTLNVFGKTAHGIWSKEYVTVKNCSINVLEAVKDGVNCNQSFTMESGALTIKGVGSDGIQISYDEEVETDRDEEDTGMFTLLDGTIDLTITANAAKGVKADGDILLQGGTITVNQTGSIEVEADDISYPTSIKSDGNIVVSGGTVNITNTAEGGKGMSAEGTLTINETNATTIIDIKANGKGGTAETTGTSTDDDTEASYKVYICLTVSGGGGMGPGGGNNTTWTNPVLYTSDGTKVASLTSTISKSSGYQTLTFYYYDFKNTDSSLSYYIQADPRTGRGTSYTPRTTTFSAPTSGTDIYYSLSNSYQTNGSYRIYQLSNVTNTYGGTSDVSEDNGTAYNAIGIKADKDLTISAGTITIANNGNMSKSIKSKKNVTIDGGSITLKPAGAMQVISNDASYSSGIKCDDFTLNAGKLDITATGAASRGVSADNITTNGGTLTITGTGAGQTGTNDTYTSKGLKADQSIALNDGVITITMSGTGGKGIKSAGTYTQGKSDGSGPTLTVNTSGSSLGGNGGGGGGWGGPQSSGGSSAKAIKVQGKVTLYGGTTEISTKTDGAEGLESKTSVDIQGGQHYLACYDDCINSSGAIYFNGGVTVCYSNGNDAVDSNYGSAGAVTIGNGVAFAYTTRGAPEEGFDCDNNSYIQITGTGIGISAGASQGGGGGGWGGGTSGNTISNAKQGYYFCTSNISYSAGRYYTLADSNGKNLVTYSFPASCSSSLGLFTATGMVKGQSYNIKYSTTAPTDATTAWHGIYVGSTHTGSTSVTSFTAQ